MQLMNWEAISAVATAAGAIATFAAVIVALLPTFAERKRKQAIASNLRGRLLSNLIALRPRLMEFSDRRLSFGLTAFSDADKNLMRSLENMIPEAIVLEVEEHELLMVTITKLKLLAVAFQASSEADKLKNAQHTLKVLDLTIDKLQSGKWLQGKMLPPL